MSGKRAFKGVAVITIMMMTTTRRRRRRDVLG
jgi:hypothetical protein